MPIKTLEKIERRLGEKLLLKGERCAGPKCALVRRKYPPGVHGRSRRGSQSKSEFGELLQIKQKVRYLYGLTDSEMKKYVLTAVSKSGIFDENLFEMLERRLDNVVFRLGFTDSRRKARQIVSHGHIMVKPPQKSDTALRKVTIPSYQVRKGETIAIRKNSLTAGVFGNLDLKLKKHQTPQWLKLDKNKKEGIIVAMPDMEDAGVTLEVTKIKEFYSK